MASQALKSETKEALSGTRRSGRRPGTGTDVTAPEASKETPIEKLYANHDGYATLSDGRSGQVKRKR